MTFGALEIGSKSGDFFMVFPGGGRAEATHPLGALRSAHQRRFANKTSSYNAITVYNATKYQIYKTGTINKLTCLETYHSQPGGPLKGPADT